jgi:uncharacterized membrane protein
MDHGRLPSLCKNARHVARRSRSAFRLGIVFVLLIPVFIAGIMEGCRAVEEGQELKILHLACGFQRNAGALVTLGGISLIGNLAVVMIVYALGGEAFASLAKTVQQNPQITPQMAEQMQGAFAIVGRAFLIATLLSLPLLMALWYAPMLVYFQDMGPLAAMKSSFFACLKNTMPMLIYGLAVMAGMFIAMPLTAALGQYDLSLWLLAPVVLPSLYVSFRDIYVAEAPPPAPIP